MNKLSFVIPCYNSSASIRQVVDSIRDICRENTYPYQIILSNDGSKDNVWEVISSLCKEDKRIRCDIYRSRPF